MCVWYPGAYLPTKRIKNIAGKPPSLVVFRRRDIDYLISAAVNDLCSRRMLVLLLDHAVVAVHVAVEHISRFIFLKEIIETFESLMRVAVRHVAEAGSRGVGNKYIETARHCDLGLSHEHTALHLCFSELIEMSVAVFDASAKSEEP